MNISLRVALCLLSPVFLVPRGFCADPPPNLVVWTAVELEMFTELGKTYELQTSLDLTNWVPTQALAGVGEPASVFLSTRDAQAGYFRLLEKAGSPGFAVPDMAGLEMVYLPAGWWVSKCEVTQAQFETLAGFNPSKFKGPQRPVESIWWDDAVVFCAKLTEREQKAGHMPVGFTNYVYRLPTHDEWLYAYQGGTTNAYFWGDTATDVRIYGWVDKTSTLEVGKRLSNGFGLHDIVGNVWEFTSSERPEGKLAFGGSWSGFDSRHYMADWPGRYLRKDLDGTVGFRVVLAPAE